MASHQIAIAKASFSAGLLRPDPTSVSRDEIASFHSSLDRALSHCTPTNIQTCKSWLLNYVVLSSNRVGVLGKYLVALSASFAPPEEDGKHEKPPKPAGNDNNNRRETSAKRKRLHILYLLNDLFHHTKYHSDTAVAFSTLSGSLQPYIVELLGYASSYDRQKNPKHHKRLDGLLDIWDEHGYYAHDYVKKLREVVKNSASTGAVKASIGIEESNAESGKKLDGKNVPFIMPSTHGDPSTPYYDLPAGNLVPHMIPNSTVPLRPESIKPLQFLAGPADEKLVFALQSFLGEVDRIYGSEEAQKPEDGIVDLDELGQTVIRDEVTGDIINGETYYGWSRAFCQQMKKRNAEEDPYYSRSRSRSLSRSYSRSRSRSLSRSRSRSIGRPQRRRRYSDSPMSDGSRRSRSRGRSRRYASSYSRSRSPISPPPRRRLSRSPPSRERSYSPPPPASPSPPPPPPPASQPYHPRNDRPYQYQAPPAPPGTTLPPRPPAPHFPPRNRNNQQFNSPPPAPWNPGLTSAPPPPPPQAFNYNYNTSTTNNGSWPPPSHQPPYPTMAFPPGMNMSGPPPPFPPPSFYGSQYSHHPPPPPPSGAAQSMPPGSYHYPPLYHGDGGGGNGNGNGNGNPWDRPSWPGGSFRYGW